MHEAQSILDAKQVTDDDMRCDVMIGVQVVSWPLLPFASLFCEPDA